MGCDTIVGPLNYPLAISAHSVTRSLTHCVCCVRSLSPHATLQKKHPQRKVENIIIPLSIRSHLHVRYTERGKYDITESFIPRPTSRARHSSTLNNADSCQRGNVQDGFGPAMCESRPLRSPFLVAADLFSAPGFPTFHEGGIAKVGISANEKGAFGIVMVGENINPGPMFWISLRLMV